MKRIVLIDPFGECVEEILNDSETYIECLVVYTENDKEKIKASDRIGQILINADLSKLNDTSNLTYEIIEEMKDIQLSIENALTRQTSNFQRKKKLYYMALNFWIGVFNEHLIDAVIIRSLNHGMLEDGIPYGIAMKRGINVYTMDPAMLSKRMLWEHNKNRLIELNNEQSDCEAQKYYNVDYDLINSIEINKSSRAIKLMVKLIYAMHGYLGVKLLYCFKRRSFRFNFLSGIDYSFFKEIHSYFEIKCAERFLKKKEGLMNKDDKYIFYAMHFEPEGGIIARTVLETQYCIIRMLEQSLPEGWVVYVKEHPHQYKLNTWMFSPYIYNIENFKSKEFYQDIATMKKVKLINRDISSKELIRNAKAVATMNGTVALEATDAKKPVLLFASETSILGKCGDCFRIRSYNDCKDAIKKIMDGFIPTYDDLNDIIEKYLADDNIEGYNLIIRSIIRDLRR